MLKTLIIVKEKARCFNLLGNQELLFKFLTLALNLIYQRFTEHKQAANVNFIDLSLFLALVG